MSSELNNTDNQYSLFNKKRALLAALVRVAQDLNGHTHSLQDALLLAKPSQKYPIKVIHYKEQLDRHIIFLDEPQLLRRSRKYDSQTIHLLNSLLEFIELTQLQVADDKDPNEFSEDARFQLDEFKTVTKSTIGIRILLQDLGIILSPVKFGFPQEWISEHIASLNATNHKLRLKVKDRIAELIYDADHLLLNKNLPSSIHDGLSYVQDAMKINLEFLFHGGNVDQLPYGFEALDITAIPQSTIHEHLAQQKNIQIATNNMKNENASENSMKFNKKLKVWLNTPWKKRWRDIR